MSGEILGGASFFAVRAAGVGAGIPPDAGAPVARQPRPVAARPDVAGAARWHGSGAWGKWFDNPPAEDADLTLADWQVIDLAGAVEHEDWCEAALLYLLERLRTEIESPAEATRLKLMVVDEAWR